MELAYSFRGLVHYHHDGQHESIQGGARAHFLQQRLQLLILVMFQTVPLPGDSAFK